jgi:hypothetical protein
MNKTIYPISLSVSNKQNRVKDPSNFRYKEIHTEAELVGVLKYDHVFSKLKNGYRSCKNFEKTKLLWGDIDNTHSEDPNDWVTIKSFKEKFKEFNWFLYTSKSHGLEKDGKTPRDKFHVVFPLDREILDGKEVKELLIKLYDSFEPFDGQVKDQTHFFIGTDDCCKEFESNLDGRSIEKYINSSGNGSPNIDTKYITPSGNGNHSLGNVGSRNSQLTSIAGFLRSKFGMVDNDLQSVLFGINQKNFNQPLSNDEVKTITQSVSGYPTSNTNSEFWSEKNGTPDKIVSFRLTNDFLKGRDFGIHVYDESLFNKNISKEESGMEIVKKEDHIIKKYGGGRLEEYIHTYLDEIGRRDVRELYDNKATTLSNKQKISIGRMNIKFFQDDKDSCYLFFQSGVVRITKDRIDITQSIDMDGKCIWESQIISRDVKILDDSNWVEGHFEQLVKLSMSQLKDDGDPYNDKDWELDKAELKSLMTAYGSLISNYKSPDCNKVFLFIDREGGDKNQGRTGKSIVMNSIGEYKKHAQLAGKDFSNLDSFNWDQVDTDTKFVSLDDVKSSSGKMKPDDFCFVDLYSRVTGTFTVNKKYGSRFTFPPDTSPKLGITSNKALTMSGESSSDARMNVVEFHPYWNRQDRKFGSGCVKRRFGQSLLSSEVATGEWKDDDPQWNYFYNFGFRCVQEFLKHGLFQPERTDYKRKQLLKSIGDDDVIIWVENWLKVESPKLEEEEGVKLDDLFLDFNLDYASKNYTKRKFKKHLKEIAETYDYEWNKGKKLNDNRWQRTVNKQTEEYILVCPSDKLKKKINLEKMIDLMSTERERLEKEVSLYPWEYK